MSEQLIERDEVGGATVNVSDIAASLAQIEELLKEDSGEEEADE